MALRTLSDNHDHVRLTDDQFEKLVELLTPGYELAKQYLEQQKADQERRAAYDAEHAPKATQEDTAQQSGQGSNENSGGASDGGKTLADLAGKLG